MKRRLVSPTMHAIGRRLLASRWWARGKRANQCCRRTWLTTTDAQTLEELNRRHGERQPRAERSALRRSESSAGGGWQQKGAGWVSPLFVQPRSSSLSTGSWPLQAIARLPERGAPAGECVRSA